MNARVALLLALFLLASGCNSGVSSPGPRPQADTHDSRPCAQWISGNHARKLIAEGGLLLDVRSAGEFAEQHLDGASNINVDDLPARLGELERERHIVVYCRSGRRSANAAKLLRDSGFTVSDIGRMAQFDERAPAGCAP